MPSELLEQIAGELHRIAFRLELGTGAELERLGELTAAVARLAEETADQAETIAALANRQSSLYAGLRPLMLSKAAAGAMICADCGGEYASEPGPPLCGSCWSRHGRPDIWPATEASRR